MSRVKSSSIACFSFSNYYYSSSDNYAGTQEGSEKGDKTAKGIKGNKERMKDV
jgi:hypothetical protein